VAVQVEEEPTAITALAAAVQVESYLQLTSLCPLGHATYLSALVVLEDRIAVRLELLELEQ
jgi:hypothetical protein